MEQKGRGNHGVTNARDGGIVGLGSPLRRIERGEM